MCGISGLYSYLGDKKAKAIIQDMTGTLSHRGPDAAGQWISEKVPLYLGHRRLSIIDLSAGGAQPMTSPSGRYTLSYNGEFYNFLDMKRALGDADDTYQGHSDTEVFLHALDKWGLEQTVARFEGMFAFALWDAKDRALSLVRDRFGKKPLYIGWAGQDLLFASELKSFHAHPGFKKEVSSGARDIYTRYGHIPAPHTIFKDVFQLLPGHIITLTTPELSARFDLTERMTPYWSAQDILSRTPQDNISVPEAKDMMRASLSAAVEKRMISDVPLGAFLSGGIDSSLITAMMCAQSNGAQVKTYSIGFKEKKYDEAPHARQIADHLGTDHYEHYFTASDALSLISELPLIYDEPFADIAALPSILLCRFARENVTVALSGDGGDEMMGGYARHIHARSLQNLSNFIPNAMKPALNYLLSHAPANLQNRLSKLSPFLTQKDVKYIIEQLLWSDTNLKSASWVSEPASFPLLEYLENNAKNIDFKDLIIHSDILHTLPNKFLVKMDRSSMSASLEVRSPFLDPAILELASRLPYEMKIKNGIGKWLLREILAEYMPRELFERPKQGFKIPLESWLKNELRDWAEDLLDRDALDVNGLNADYIRAQWQAYLNGKSAPLYQLWSICQYQAWAREWL